MNGMGLMNRFHELNREALASEAYESALIYSTAEDLTDAILKGGPADGPDRLLTALQHNADRAHGTERATWLHAHREAKAFFEGLK